MLSGSPLLLYHFQSLRVFSGHWIDLYFGGVRLPQTVRKLIYEPYLEALARSYRRLRGVAAVKGLGMAPLPRQIWFWLAYSKRVILGQVIYIDTLCSHDRDLREGDFSDESA